MKHFIRYSMAVLPLLTLLAMSPSDIQVKTQSNYRSIASALPETKSLEKELPKLSEGKFLPKGNFPMPKHKLDGQPLIADAAKPTLAEKKDDKKTEEVKPEDKKEEKPVVAEEKKDDKKSEEVKPEDKKEERPVVADCEEKKPEDKQEDKPLEHPLIKQALEAGEKPVVADCKIKDEKKPEEKKEETKKEEQIVVKDDKKPEDKKEEDKKEKAEVCEQDEKVQTLTKQVEQLLADQKQIMQTMMSMTQAMMTMISQQQNQNPWAPYMNSMGMQSPYQYQQPMTAGNWVYYPQGFQPNQINIFAQPQMQGQQPMQQLGGIYPDQMHTQQSSSWGLQPQYNFGQAMPMQMQPSAGTFGTDGIGFNMSPITSPSVSMMR
ncbi:hypothetical protein ACJVC5_19365 [Peredibacter sp. HCB2-198]|uniref:hypothetical protein n=1 Tax=Peredibacter sp. HCB2-198 TaxID=3383025 RepID=UPI0038B67424